MFLIAKWVGVTLVATAIWAASAFAADVENGDLFVGSNSVVDGNSNTTAGIFRVRNGGVTVFCASPASSDNPNYWNAPNDVIVDSQGRIVFIAPIGGQNWGLLRCTTLGAPAEQIAAFHVGNSVPAGWPDPFPALRFGVPGYSGFVTSLHSLKQRVITDDFQSKPQVHNADAYEFVAQEEGPNPQPPTELFRYDTETQTWKYGADLPGTPNMTSVVAHGDSLYMLLGSSVLRRTSLPLKISLSGKVNGVDFNLTYTPFGGVHEISGADMDDTTVPNVSSGCNTDPPGKHDDVTDLMPYNNGFSPLSADRLTYDEQGDLGLVLLSGYGPYPGPYLTQTSSALLDDDPNNDVEGYFHQPHDNCRHVPWIQFAPILPFVSQDGTFGNAANVIATAPGGMVGTQLNSDRVIRLTPGDKATVIATLYRPQGIAAYPAVVPSLGTVVYLTIHSPVDVLVTDAAGKRIGVDPDTGNPVNDFGANGFDSGAGEPRIFAINKPTPGGYKIDAIGTGSGSYTIDISTADLATGASDRIQTSGNVSIGDRFKPGFTLSPQSNLAFVVRAASRKIHGNAGAFNVDLPLDGSGIESRSGGASGDYTIVFTFVNPLTHVDGANVTSGTASSVSGAIDSNDPHNYIVNLTGVTNAQTIAVTLTNVTDSASNFSSAVAGSMAVLIGDTNADRFVDSADIGQTKSESGNAVGSSNFREDINTDGFIDSADIGFVKSRSGSTLPPPPPSAPADSSSATPTSTPPNSSKPVSSPKTKPRSPARSSTQTR